jgi:hypothetical protein
MVIRTGPATRWAAPALAWLLWFSAADAQTFDPDAGATFTAVGSGSLFRYGAVGLGAYPYLQAVPVAGMRATLDGVPLRSRSPFGPDLETVPDVFIDSLGVSGTRMIDIRTEKDIPEIPVTDTRFLSGIRDRFTIDVLFRTALTDSIGITAGGSSSGMRERLLAEAEHFIPEANLRNYLFTLRRDLASGGILYATLRGGRAVRGLADLERGVAMGERKTTEATLSGGISGMALPGGIVAEPLVYYQRSSSRFARYGDRKRLSDDMLGGRMTGERTLGNTTLGFDLAHRWIFFDAPLHGRSFTRTGTEAAGLYRYGHGRLELRAEAGLQHDSEYGFAPGAEAEIAWALTGTGSVFAGASRTAVYPTIADEFYTALEFSDSTVVYTLDRGQAVSGEAGVRYRSPLVRAEAAVFAGLADAPVFLPPGSRLPDGGVSALPVMVMSGNLASTGARATFETSYEREDVFQFMLRSENRGRWTDGGEAALFPAIESITGGTVTALFYEGQLAVRGFARAGVYWWDRGAVIPEDMYPAGTRFLMDVSVSIQVATLELFYRVENITNENIRWFRTIDWQGRNSLWGGRWIFYQ